VSKSCTRKKLWGRVTKLTNEFGRLLRFGLVGIVATVVYTAACLLAIEVLMFSPLEASVLGFTAAMGISYYGHTVFSFKLAVDHRSYLHRFATLTAVSFITSTGMTWLLSNVMNVPHRIVLAILFVVLPAISYVCNRFWVFHAGLSNTASFGDPQ